MKYTKEQRLAWVLAYKNGRLDASMTPPGITRRRFSRAVRTLAKVFDRFGEAGLEKSEWRTYTKEFKLAAVMRVEAGESEFDRDGASNRRSALRLLLEELLETVAVE